MSLPSIPKTVQIGPYTFTIDIDQEYITTYSKENNIEVDGLSEFQTQKIVLADFPGLDHRCQILLHEVLHMCLGVAGYQEDEEIEEKFVSTLAVTLLDTLRRNPELVIYLLHPHDAE